MKAKGLGLIPPIPRLSIVIIVGIFYILIDKIWMAGALCVAGIIIFFSSSRNWKLALTAIAPGLMLLFYNTILSPADSGGYNWFIFTVNQVGVERGLVTGLRLIGVMLISFAWLATTPIPQMYEGLSWIPGREWLIELLRGIQIIKREFVVLTQSLIIRGLKWDSPLANVRNLLPLLMAIIPRIVDNAQKTTFARRVHVSEETTVPKSGIVVNDLSIRYTPELPDVLHQVSLEIGADECIYLAGPDMAGKTSLLRAIGGVIPWIMGEMKGAVEVDRLVVHDTRLSQIAGISRYVAPDPFASLYGLTVGQEIMFLARDEQHAREVLEVMGLSQELWDRETTKLSGGQQVRLVLAGALAANSRYLLLDSPMQELDPEGRNDFREALMLIRAQRQIGLAITDPFWQMIQGDIQRVVVMESGIISDEVDPASFFRDPTWLTRCHLTSQLPQLSLPTPGDVIAKMDGVHVVLEGNHILKGLDFSIRQGELVAIVGSNGSGKSTAMLTLAGAIKPKQGSVVADGRLAYVFQHAALQTVAMTVREELALGPKILGWSEDDITSFVEAGLEWTGLAPETCPLDLHPSQVKLLAIASSITDASVVILDEPTIGVDYACASKIMSKVTNLLEQGKSVIIITHDEQIAQLANRVVVISEGRVVSEYSNPKSPIPQGEPTLQTQL